MEEKDNPIVVPTVGNVEPLSRLFLINPTNAKFLTGQTKYIHRSVHTSFLLLALTFVFILSNFTLAKWHLQVIALAIIGLILILVYRQIQRLNALSEQGRIIQGNIVKVDQAIKHHRSTSRWWEMKLYCQFKTPDDRILCKQIVTHTEFPEQFPSKGTPIVVLYQDDQNYTIL